MPDKSLQQESPSESQLDERGMLGRNEDSTVRNRIEHNASEQGSTEHSEDRRQRPRYDRASLVLMVDRPGLAGFFRATPKSKCLNFNRQGLRFGSNQRFAAKDRLVMDLRIGDIALNEINAEVIDCNEESPGNYATCVKFCFAAKSMRTPSVTRALLQIEDLLRCAEAFPLTNQG